MLFPLAFAGNFHQSRRFHDFHAKRSTEISETAQQNYGMFLPGQDMDQAVISPRLQSLIDSMITDRRKISIHDFTAWNLYTKNLKNWNIFPKNEKKTIKNWKLFNPLFDPSFNLSNFDVMFAVELLAVKTVRVVQTIRFLDLPWVRWKSPVRKDKRTQTIRSSVSPRSTCFYHKSFLINPKLNENVPGLYTNWLPRLNLRKISKSTRVHAWIMAHESSLYG